MNSSLDPVLLRVWRELVNEPSPPFLDSWLSRKLPQCKGLSHNEQLKVGARIREAVKYQYLVVLAEFLTRQKSSSHDILHDFTDRSPDPATFYSLLKEIPARRFFLLLDARLGKRSDSCAAGIMKRVRTAARGRPGVLAWNGIPHWYADALEQRITLSGWTCAEVETFARRTLEPAPLWIRLNHPSCRDTVTEDLRLHGFAVSIHDAALLVSGSGSIFALPTFKAGYFEVQDFSSQRIAQVADAHPGQAIWDCCAGAGGKTLAMAAALEKRGILHATDLYGWKLESLRKRLKRCGFHDIVRLQQWTGTSLPQWGVEISKRGGFHRVLVDAPCSASGTWQRNPDAKFQFSPQGREELTQTQRKLLSHAAEAVRPGGKLIYATCSFDPAENEEVVHDFLVHRSVFECERQELLGSPRAPGDTMFVAVLVRKP